MIFTVDGKPQGKARPRFNSYSGTVYTPKNTLDEETEKATALKVKGTTILNELVKLRIALRIKENQGET